MVDLSGRYAGADNFSAATAVSASGQVVGGSNLSNGWDAFSWTQAGGMVDLGTFYEASYALAVNQSGQVAGWAATNTTPSEDAFSWTQAGGMVNLGTLGGTVSSPSSPARQLMRPASRRPSQDKRQLLACGCLGSGHRH